MALPKLGVPYYDLELVSGKKIQYRPFTVKEEKALLIASESKDKSAIVNAVRNTLNSCILQEEDNKISIENLPMFDVELLFINIRMKSVGEMSEFNYICEECDGSPSVKTKIDLRKIRVENKDKGGTKKIMITSNVGVELQYPPFKTFLSKNSSEASSSVLALDMISDCILNVFDEKQVYTKKDFSEKEIKEFVESLTQEQLKKMNSFFENSPRLVYDLEVECPCGKKSTKQLQGISDFFS